MYRATSQIGEAPNQNEEGVLNQEVLGIKEDETLAEKSSEGDPIKAGNASSTSSDMGFQ